MSTTPLVSDMLLSNFPSLFAEALDTYKQKTGTDLQTHPLFVKLQGCDTAEKVIAVLVGTCNAFDDFRKRMAFKWIKHMVDVLMSITSLLGDGTTVVSASPFCTLSCIHFSLLVSSCHLQRRSSVASAFFFRCFVFQMVIDKCCLICELPGGKGCQYEL